MVIPLNWCTPPILTVRYVELETKGKSLHLLFFFKKKGKNSFLKNECGYMGFLNMEFIF